MKGGEEKVIKELLTTTGVLEAKSRFGFKLANRLEWFTVGSYRRKYLDQINKGTLVEVTYYVQVGNIRSKPFYNITYIKPVGT